MLEYRIAGIFNGRKSSLQLFNKTVKIGIKNVWVELRIEKNLLTRQSVVSYTKWFRQKKSSKRVGRFLSLYLCREIPLSVQNLLISVHSFSETDSVRKPIKVSWTASTAVIAELKSSVSVCSNWWSPLFVFRSFSNTNRFTPSYVPGNNANPRATVVNWNVTLWDEEMLKDMFFC